MSGLHAACRRGRQSHGGPFAGQGGGEKPDQSSAATQSGPAGALLGLPVRQPEARRGRDLRHVRVGPECGRMQGRSLYFYQKNSLRLELKWLDFWSHRPVHTKNHSRYLKWLSHCRPLDGGTDTVPHNPALFSPCIPLDFCFMSEGLTRSSLARDLWHGPRLACPKGFKQCDFIFAAFVLGR